MSYNKTLLSRRIASSYSKKAGIFKAPPALLKEVSTFMVKKYAGHILALTEKRLATLKSESGESSSLMDPQRAEAIGREKFTTIFDFLNRKDFRDGEEETFEIQPDIGKKIWIGVEVILGRPHFSYAYVKKGRSKGREYGLFTVAKIWNKMRKIYQKEIGELVVKARKSKKVREQGPDTSLVELSRIKKTCLDYTTKAKSYKTTARTTIEIDLSGWSPVERSMKESKQKVRDLIAYLQAAKGEVSSKLEALGQGESIAFHIDAYRGKGIAIEMMREPSTILEVTYSEEGSYVLGSNFETSKDTLYEDLEELIERVEKLYEESIEFTEETLEDINWTAIYASLESVSLHEILVILDFKGHSKRGGQWHHTKKELQVDMWKDALSVDDFENNITEIIRIARHECQHVGQSVLEKLKDLRGGRPGTPSLSIREKGGPLRGRKEHALREVEFYTRIQDEVDRFIQKARTIPQKWRRLAARVWVGDFNKAEFKELDRAVNVRLERNDRIKTAEFFRALKTREPEKWKKAVKEFISAISDKVRMD